MSSRLFLNRSRLIFIVLSLLTVFLVIGGSILASTASQSEDDGSDSLYKYLALFTEVLSLVDRAYVDKPATDSLLAGAFEGTVDALDPFSLYIPADQVESWTEAAEIGISRSGLLVLKERGVAYAVTVEDGSPAAEAGLEHGDTLAEIQGESTRDLSLLEIYRLLAGPVGTRVELERIRLGVKEEISFALAEYTAPGVELEVEEGAPVLRIGSFGPSTRADVMASLEIVASGEPQAGAEALPGLETHDRLLIDLRGVAGGDSAAAYSVAGLFVSGELGILAARERTEEVFEGAVEPAFAGELVVLINRYTQGPAEVLAAVLHQSAGARLVGTYSFGHSGRQSLIRLSNGGRLRLTDAFYTGPDREPITQALEPDLVVRPKFFFGDDEEDEPGDAVLERGLAVLLGKEEIEEESASA